MHCCKNLPSVLLRASLLAWLFSATVHAEGISVDNAEMRSGEGGYQLSANYDINLNFVVRQALSRGIPIYFVGEFSLTHARWDWLESVQQALSSSLPSMFSAESPWLEKEVYSSEQAFKLSFSTLTGRYRISRGALFQNFASLEDALNILARQSSAVIPASMIKTGGNYVASARLRLDIEELPKPLQVNALTDNDWTLDSGWHRWVIDPSVIPAQNDGKME